MRNRSFEALNFADAQDLLATAHAEDQHIDYKLSLPDLDGRRPDDARRSFLADIAAFANGGGGDLVFGVEEGRTDDRPNGLPVSLIGIESPNADELHRRWSGITETGLDPRLAPGIRVKVLPIPNTTRAIVVARVSRSYASPHMVRETSRFHVRHGPQNRVLDTAEIRAAFSLSETWATHVKRWREERVARIVGQETPVRLPDRGCLALHVVPLSALNRSFSVDLFTLKARNPAPVYFERSYGPTFNVDGFVVQGDPTPDATSHTYTQFFRDGSLEVILTTVADEQHLYPNRVEPHVIRMCNLYLPLLTEAGAEYPFTVTMSLVGMRGRSSPPNNWGERMGIAIPREVVFLPDVVVEAPDADIPRVLRPSFDALWQTLGHERSITYGPDGTWKGKLNYR